MPRGRGPRVVHRPLVVTHDCLWPAATRSPGCPGQIPKSQLMCLADWDKLPTHLRNAWNDARKADSAEATDLACSAIRAYIRRNPQGRDTR